MSKEVCRGIRAGGEGSVSCNGYRPKGLRNKRKAHWSQQRRVADMLKKMKERQGNQQGSFDDGPEDAND